MVVGFRFRGMKRVGCGRWGGLRGGWEEIVDGDGLIFLFVFRGGRSRHSLIEVDGLGGRRRRRGV